MPVTVFYDSWCTIQLTDFGLLVRPYSERWAGYYRMADWTNLQWIANAEDQAPERITISIRIWEDLTKEIYGYGHNCRK